MATISSKTLLAVLFLSLSAQAAPSMRWIGQACKFKDSSGAAEVPCETKFGVMTIREGGAKGDGSTDDTVAFQRVLATGKSVVCNAGDTYLVQGGLTASTAGQAINMTGCKVRLATGASSHGILTLNAINMKVTGGEWDLNVAGNATGDPFGYFAVLLGADHGVMENTYVHDSFGIGLKASAGTNYGTARFNYVVNTALVGILFDGAQADMIGNAAHNNTVDISSNLSGASGIYIASAAPETFVHRRWRITDNTVIGPAVSSTSVAITARGLDGIVSGNHVIGSDIGISVDISSADSSTIIIGNRVDALSTSTFGLGIEANGSKILTTGNIVRGGKTGFVGSSNGTPSGTMDYQQIVGNQFVEQTVNALSLQPGAGHTAQHINISGNTFISTLTAQQGLVHLVQDCRFSIISGNLFKLNGSAGGGVAVFLDTVNSDVTVVGNRFSSVQTAMVGFNAAAVAQTNMMFNNNDVSDGVGILGANLISVSGLATAGSGLQMVGNFRGGANVFRDDTLDKATNVISQISNSFNSPEAGVTAGPGSMYINKNGFKPGLWIKETGTGNTGWSGMPVKGKATLSGGTVTVSTASVTAASPIALTNCASGGTPGLLSVGTIVAGTSFVINSANGADTSIVCWTLNN